MAVLSQKDHASKKLLPQKGHVSKMSCLKKVIVANGSSLNNVIVMSQKGCCCKLFISQNGYVSKGLFCKVIMSQKGHNSKEVIPHNDSWLLGAPEVERFFSQIRLCSCKKNHVSKWSSFIVVAVGQMSCLKMFMSHNGWCRKNVMSQNGHVS